jgi:hypothetical protein
METTGTQKESARVTEKLKVDVMRVIQNDYKFTGSIPTVDGIAMDLPRCHRDQSRIRRTDIILKGESNACQGQKKKWDVQGKAV